MTRADARLLPLGAVVVVAGAPAKIERRAGTEERPILRLEGHAGREAAEGLRGQPLLVARGDLPELEADEYWAHELEGCAVTDGGRAVGTVRQMRELPSVEVLEVVREDGEELLVPMVSGAVRSIDVPARRIDVDLGFLGAD